MVVEIIFFLSSIEHEGSVFNAVLFCKRYLQHQNFAPYFNVSSQTDLGLVKDSLTFFGE